MNKLLFLYIIWFMFITFILVLDIGNEFIQDLFLYNLLVGVFLGGVYAYQDIKEIVQRARK